MSEFMLCVTALFLLSWVVYLKVEVRSLARKLEKLAHVVRSHLKEKTGDVELSDNVEVWGKKPKWMK